MKRNRRYHSNACRQRAEIKRPGVSLLLLIFWFLLNLIELTLWGVAIWFVWIGYWAIRCCLKSPLACLFLVFLENFYCQGGIAAELGPAILNPCGRCCCARLLSWCFCYRMVWRASCNSTRFFFGWRAAVSAIAADKQRQWSSRSGLLCDRSSRNCSS